MSSTKPWMSSIVNATPTKVVEHLRKQDITRDESSRSFMFYTATFTLVSLGIFVGWLAVSATRVTPISLETMGTNLSNSSALNSFSSAGTAPGVTILFMLMAGVFEFIFICWVYRHVPSDKTLRGVVGFGRGWFSAGIYFCLQAAVVALASYDLLGVALGIECGVWVFSMAVWIVMVRSRINEIKISLLEGKPQSSSPETGMFDWRIYLGAEMPHEIYWGAASHYMFWSFFSLGLANHDTWFFIAEDTISTILIPIWFGAGTLLICLFTLSLGLPAFYAILLFFIGTYNQGVFPMTSTAAYMTALINVFAFGWSLMENMNLSTYRLENKSL